MKKMKKISKKVLTGKLFWDILTPLLRKTRNSKKKNKKLQKSVDKQNTTKYNNKVSLLKKSKLNQYGEVSEWFKELVLKTSDSERGRGFESHSLRQLNIFFIREHMEKYPSG